MTAKILALETSTEACSVALLAGDAITTRIEIVPNRHTQLILPMVEQALSEAGTSLTELDAIAYSQGPGSFTGLRIGCGVAQGLAFGADLPLIPISTLRTLAQGGVRTLGAQAVIAILDARLHEVYWGCYRVDSNSIMQALQNDQLSKPEQVTLPTLDIPYCGVGYGWKIYSDLLSVCHNKLIKKDFKFYPQAQDAVRLAHNEWQAKHLIAPEQASLVYLRNDVAAKRQ